MRTPSLDDVVDDLEAEEADLDDLLGSLDARDWHAATPAAGWTVRHQVVHLAQGEELAALSIADPDAFVAELESLLGQLDVVAARTDTEAKERPPAELRNRWYTAAGATVEALRNHRADARIGWVAGPMAPRTFATARLMETFAHGHDIRAALGQRPVATPRLVHVCDLGVRTRRSSFAARGHALPPEPRVELEGPAGERWVFGPDDADECVEGDALEFCEVVVQRRHLDDTSLRTEGAGARRWLEIAQAFAGPATSGPRPSRAE